MYVGSNFSIRRRRQVKANQTKLLTAVAPFVLFCALTKHLRSVLVSELSHPDELYHVLSRPDTGTFPFFSFLYFLWSCLACSLGLDLNMICHHRETGSGSMEPPFPPFAARVGLSPVPTFSRFYFFPFSSFSVLVLIHMFTSSSFLPAPSFPPTSCPPMLPWQA